MNDAPPPSTAFALVSNELPGVEPEPLPQQPAEQRDSPDALRLIDALVLRLAEQRPVVS